jgi:hypothetical protein
VDGGAQIKPGKILECLRRVVFLSVPHWGTNIADGCAPTDSGAKRWWPGCGQRSAVHNC